VNMGAAVGIALIAIGFAIWVWSISVAPTAATGSLSPPARISPIDLMRHDRRDLPAADRWDAF
jgi:hypothetical protein